MPIVIIISSETISYMDALLTHNGSEYSIVAAVVPSRGDASIKT